MSVSIYRLTTMTIGSSRVENATHFRVSNIHAHYFSHLEPFLICPPEMKITQVNCLLLQKHE